MPSEAPWAARRFARSDLAGGFVDGNASEPETWGDTRGSAAGAPGRASAATVSGVTGRAGGLGFFTAVVSAQTPSVSASTPRGRTSIGALGMCSSEYLYVIYTSQLGQRFAAGAPDPNERHLGQNKTALKKRRA